jgi:manganese oxidase
MYNFSNKMMAATAAISLVALLAGCSGSQSGTPAKTVQAAETGSHTMNSSDEMDKAHMDSMKAFPAATEGKGAQELEPEVAKDGTKVFHVSVTKVKWEVAPGQKLDAYAYNGQVPGPIMRVTQGDHVQIVVKNDMTDESTALHLHGLLLDNKMDGVPGLTQDPIKPGTTYTYDFMAVNAGSQMYHSHYNSTTQQTHGLYGAFIVAPKEDAINQKYNVTQDHVMMVGDGMLGFTINGKQFPATEPIMAKVGETIRVRYYNGGQIPHPMHLHGLTQLVVAKDGYDLDVPYKADTILVAPGERYDVIVKADNAGTWAWHCHILGHAENEHGMFGMVTAMIVK